MNKNIKKNNCLKKDEINNEVKNVLNILEKKKKVIIAHDRGRRRDAILGKTISYVIKSALDMGIKKPVILCVNYDKSELKRSKNVLYVGNIDDMQALDLKSNKNISDEEEIVAIVVECFDILVSDIIRSTNLLEYMNMIKGKYNILYEIITMNDLFCSPVLLPFITFRIIDNKFSKLVGVEGSDHLAELFYDVGRETKPKTTGFIINKKIAEYIDLDLYNYVDKNNFIKPEVYKHKTTEAEVRAALDIIREIDRNDNVDLKPNKSRVHMIICNNINSFMEKYKDMILKYINDEYKNVEKLIAIRNIDMFSKWHMEYELDNKHYAKKTIIFVVQSHNFSIAPWHIILDKIKSISFLSATMSKDNLPISLKDFMKAYDIAYSCENNTRNKIFIHCRGDYINYDNYIEMKYLISNDLPYKFDMNILKTFYDNYLTLGSINKKNVKTSTFKNTA